jgi:hypothetical protein
MGGVADKAGDFVGQRHVPGDGDRLGHHHLVIVERIVHDAGDAAQRIADAVAGREAGEDAAVVVDLDLFGVEVPR